MDGKDVSKEVTSMGHGPTGGGGRRMREIIFSYQPSNGRFGSSRPQIYHMTIDIRKFSKNGI